MSTCYAFASVSIPSGERDWSLFADPVDFYAVVLSLAPWGIAAALFTLLAISARWRASPMFRAVCLSTAVAFLTSEAAKRVVQQPRPAGTCLHSTGMPSSHSAVSAVWFVFMLLRVRAGEWAEVAAAMQQLTDVATSTPAASPAMVPSSSSSSSSAESRRAFAMRMALALNIAMIPWSRVYLLDHSVAQVIAGSCVGLSSALSVAWHFSRRYSDVQRTE